MERKYGFDLEMYFEEIDKIVSKYRKFPNPDALIYVRGLRMPLVEKELFKLQDTGSIETTNAVISDKPFHPVIGAYLAAEVIKCGMIGQKNKLLLDSNPLLGKDSKLKAEVFGCSGSIDDIIFSFLGEMKDLKDGLESKLALLSVNSPRIGAITEAIDEINSDVSDMGSILIDMLDKVDQMRLPDDSLLDVDVSKDLVIITVKDSLAFLRMKEAGYI